MKNQLLTLIALTLLVFASCQPAAEQAAAEQPAESPDYAAFNSKVSVIKAFFKAYMDEDMAAMEPLVADTLRWSPAVYNGGEWLGKEDFLAALQNYHNEYDNIQFQEGIDGIADTPGAANGYWSGSVFPESTATDSPDIIRVYGTWTATHVESGKEIGAKWYGLVWVNVAGQIGRFTDYYDVHGLAAQLADE